MAETQVISDTRVMSDTQGISMASSKYSWEDVARRAKELNIDRSKYVQHCIEKDLDKRRFVTPIEVIMLLSLAVITLLLVIIFMKV